eukprot:15337261-Alexandrium_andersonii.AAC.1
MGSTGFPQVRGAPFSGPAHEQASRGGELGSETLHRGFLRGHAWAWVGQRRTYTDKHITGAANACS